MFVNNTYMQVRKNRKIIYLYKTNGLLLSDIIQQFDYEYDILYYI